MMHGQRNIKLYCYLVKSFQASPVRPSDKSNKSIKMRMKLSWNDTNRGKGSSLCKMTLGATSSHTNVTRNSPRSNPCLCGIFQHKCHMKMSEFRTHASAVSSKTNVTRNSPRSTPCLCGKKPATDSPIHVNPLCRMKIN